MSDSHQERLTGVWGSCTPALNFLTFRQKQRVVLASFGIALGDPSRFGVNTVKRDAGTGKLTFCCVSENG